MAAHAPGARRGVELILKADRVERTGGEALDHRIGVSVGVRVGNQENGEGTRLAETEAGEARIDVTLGCAPCAPVTPTR